MRREDSPLRRRLSIIRGYVGRSTHIAPTPHQPHGPSRHAPPPNQRLLAFSAIRPPLRNRHRQNVKILVRSGVKTRHDRDTRNTTNRTRSTECTLATRQRPSVPSGLGAIPLFANNVAIFFLQILRSVVGERWGGLVRLTPRLRRDMQWWTDVPSQSNGKPIHKPIETACLHTVT
jgi:hypothetical protein